MSDDVDLSYSDVEEALRDSVRAVLRKRCAPDQATALFDGDRTGVGELWRTLTVELGLAGLLVPEEFGGAGATAREAAVVLEELGQIRRAGAVPDQCRRRDHRTARGRRRGPARLRGVRRRDDLPCGAAVHRPR